MTQGVECWNASGQKTLDITSRMAKFFGTASIGWSHTGSTQSGTITDTRFTAYTGTTPFVLVISGGFSTDGGGAIYSFSGNTLTWTFPISSPADSITRPTTVFAYGII